MLAAISPKRIGWEPYVHLIWLIFLVFPPIFDPEANPYAWLLIGIIIALFLPIYFWTGLVRGRNKLIGLAALCLLGLVFVRFNYGSTSFFIYASALAAATMPTGQAVRAVVGIVIVFVISVIISGIPWPYTVAAFLPPFLMIFFIGGMNMFYAAKRRADAKLNLAHEEIERLATIAERERIARDLHDLLGHTLSVITLKSELARKLLTKDASKAQQEIGEVERISRDALAEVRAAVSGYRSKGFSEALTHAKRALEPAGVSFSFAGDPSVLTPLQESTLSLVLREAVTNILRHAEATRCSVALTEDSKKVTLEISDNGKGRQGAAIGNGLSGIAERVSHLEGNLNISSDHGMQLTIELPIEPIEVVAERAHSQTATAL